MLGPVKDDEAILLSGDLAKMTDAADTLERRLVRLACHYRQRALMAEEALRPFAVVSGVAVPRIAMPPESDRLWSYYESRTETQHEITRAHVDHAASVLGLAKEWL